jgi:peptidoglycan/xylan/chitin deacetylase (PgdA/CDA1 family)
MHDDVARLGEATAPQVVWRIHPAGTRCYLTFDDGPDAEWTPRFLEALARADCRATFFVIGRLAVQHGSMLRAALGAGHLLGNHGYGHRHPWTLGREQARREVRDGADAIAQATGARPGWFRPAHGRLSRSIVDAASVDGQRIALWTLSAVDWGPCAAPRRIRARLGELRAGDIALMHDGPLRRNRPAGTLLVLPWLLAQLAQRNLEPATLPTSLQCLDE